MECKMKRAVLLFFVTLVEYPSNISAENLIKSTDGATYLLSAPGTLLEGSPNRLCLSRLGRSALGTARLHLDVSADNDTLVTRLRKSFQQGNGGCFDLVLPRTSLSRVNLQLRLRFESQPSDEVSRAWRGVPVLAGSSLVTVQSDRALYRPGDTVRLRVLRLRPDLIPIHGPIRRVWLEMSDAIWGGRGRVAQWDQLPTRLGLAQIEYALDRHAPKGEWTVHVETEDSSETASHTFAVADYTLATFYLDVQHPSRILRSAARISWTICVRHMWGEGVRGTLSTRVHTDGSSSSVRSSTRLYGQPCHNHTVELWRLTAGEPETVVADISFQEESTRMWKNTSAVTRFVEDVVNVEFINKNKMVVSPGLPYKIKLRVTNWDEKPMSSTAVRVCRTATNSSDHSEENDVDSSSVTEPCDTVYTDVKGYIQTSFSIPNAVAASFYRIQASVGNTHANLTLPVRDGERVRAALGALGAAGLKNHVTLFVSYPPRAHVKPVTVHFVLVTRGGTIHRWGALTQCPQTSTPVSRQTPLPSVCQNPSSSRVLLRMALPARVSHQMCPHSHLLVYFQYEGRLVFATKHFKVGECFYNKVMAHWSPATVAPGNSTRLIIKSLGPALCATSASDLALQHTTHESTPTLHTQLMDKLKTFIETRKNITLKNLPPRACLSENGISDAEVDDYDYLLSTFSASGLRLMSDFLPQLDCSTDQPEHLEAPTPARERSYLPETWLWNLQHLPSNGSLEMRVQAPDAVTQYETSVFCVSRAGVSVAPVTVLKVFQPFFVDLEAPQKMKGGEHTKFFYKIFNYMDTAVAVTIDIETDQDSGISVRDAKGSVPSPHTVCVGVGDVYSVRLGLVGARVGQWRLVVNAAVVPEMLKFCGSDVGQTFPRDRIVKQVSVEPEGEPTERHRSALFCAQGDGGYPSEADWSWEGGEQVVPGTARWRLWLTGDLAGPLDLNADKLLQLPLGCGEQNMARLAHNLAALRHLELSGRDKPEARQRATENTMSGYARQITYVHPKGGFSAFGPADDQPSTWLTAFCLRYLHSARKRLSMEGPGHVLSAAEDWLLSLQMENGCFQNIGQVFHREFKGGLDSESSNIALTAYILVSLIESGTILRPSVIQSASYCLQALYRMPDASNRNYAIALVTYAQVRMERYEIDVQEKNEISLKKLKDQEHLSEKSKDDMNDDKMNIGERESELKTAYEINADNAVNVLRRSAKRRSDLVWWESDSLATSVEATSYAVLALLAAHDVRRHNSQGDTQGVIEDAGGAIKWLALHRNSAGGFYSTQDTLVALEAISVWSSLPVHTEPQLVVSVTGSGLTQNIRITSDNKYNLTSFELKPGTVNVRAEGKGCVLVQATQLYNSLEPSPKSTSPFSLQASLKTDGPFDCQYNSTWCRCAAVLEVCVSWMGRSFPEMSIVDVDLPTGYVTDKTLLYRLLDRHNTLLRRLEESESGRVLLYLAARQRVSRPRECYLLYLMGPQSKTAPARVRVYDYYHREVNASVLYTIPEDCPGTVAHEEPSRLRYDNLYRSLDDLMIENNESEESSAEVYTVPASKEYIQDIAETQTPSYKRIEKDADTKDHSNNPSIENIDTNQIFNHTQHETQGEKATANDKAVNESAKIDDTDKNNTETNFDTSAAINQGITEKSEDTNIIAKDKQTDIKRETHNEELSSGESTEVIKEIAPVPTLPTSSPHLQNFHSVDSDMDLDVPEGMEGPVPSIVAPPPGFVWEGSSPNISSFTDEKVPAEPTECADRFANWTQVTYDLQAAEQSRDPKHNLCP